VVSRNIRPLKSNTFFPHFSQLLVDAGKGLFEALQKKPAKKLFRVLCGSLSRPKKDSLQLDLTLLYTILR